MTDSADQTTPADAGQNRGRTAETHGVVVGVDGSEQSVCAADWAGREASRRGVPLTMVTAYSLPVFAASALEAGVGLPDDSAVRDGATQLLASVADRLTGVSVPVHQRVESGDAAGVLVDFSVNAELLVSGARGRGGFLGRLLGSVSSALPVHAKCPVVIVPKGGGESREASGAPVVVGVDGSEEGRVAALAAGKAARARHSEVRMVCAMPPVSGSVAWLPATVDEQALVDELQERLDAGARWLQSEFPELTVSAIVIDGTPSDVLIEQSRTARLTVVGTRGRGGIRGALLGSTSQGVTSYAQGPVMVVPYAKDRRLKTRRDYGPMMED